MLLASRLKMGSVLILFATLLLPAQAAEVDPDARSFAIGYLEWLDQCRTEVEATDWARQAAKDMGFMDMTTMSSTRQLQAGDRAYIVNHDRAIILVHRGTRPVSDGVRVLAGHTDSPRLDLKPHPVYTSHGFFQLQTFTYGGIKRYQWVNQPLQLHGLWYDKSGTRHHVIIGDDADEPTMLIPDLAPHLSKDYNGRTAGDVIGPEETDPIVGMQTDTDEAWNAKDQPAKEGDAPEVSAEEFLDMLRPYLQGKNITATDVATGEFHLVPANTPRFMGLDQSMVAAYGQDDRANSYLALQAILHQETIPEYTSLVYLVGQEEIGSGNNTGASSTFLNSVIGNLLERDAASPVPFGDNLLRGTLQKSWVLSTDTPAAVNPVFPDVWEHGNAIELGDGPAVMKWGAGRDANPVFFAQVAAMANELGLTWQVAPLGKNGAGGGGTIGGFMSREGMEVLDIGVAVISLHSPYEVTSVNDLWQGHQFFSAFLGSGRGSD